MMMMMMTVHNLRNTTFESCQERVASSASHSNEPSFLVILRSSEIRSVCLWIEVLSVFMRNSSTFDAIRDTTTSDIVLRRTVGRMMGFARQKPNCISGLL